MITVGVRDEYVGDGLAADGVKQRTDMRIVIGTGIEDRDFATANDVTDRALIGERAGIVGDQRAHLRRYLFHLPGYEIEALVERRIVGHAHAKYTFHRRSQNSTAA